MSLKQAIKAALLQQPGLSSTEIARRLGKERNNVRKAAFELETAGELRSQNDGGTFRFYVAGSSARPPEFPKPIGNSPPVIDGEFEGVSPPPSTSRALIPAAATFDSRLDATLARNERARRLRSAQGQALGQQVITSWNDLYTADPDGLETLAALQRAEFARAEAERIERERAQQASAMAQQQAVEPSMWDMGMRAAILGFDAYCSMGRQQAEARAAGWQSSATERAEPYEDCFARRQRAKREAEEVKPPSLLDQLRDRARTGTSPKTEGLSPASDRPESSWWRKHFGTPRRPVWR